VRATVVVYLSDAVDTVHQVLLLVLDLEERGDLIECFVLGFRHFLVGEHPEYCQKNAERQERIIF